jgi:hypothetical protein
MLGLIMAVAMVPGLLIGLQRTTAIDYDAVAYRTGAILAEDPGWPVFPAWELSNDKDGVDRLGLAVSKDSPNILSSTKIEKFFNSSLFEYPVDYREKIIFGDYPYRFNISLEGSGYPPVGDSRPEGYGSIRRVVKIKGSSNSIIDLNATYSQGNYNVSSFNSPEIDQTFTIRLDLNKLVDKSINPAYQFDPRIEPIDIFIKNFSAKLNNTEYFYTHNFPDAADKSNWTGPPLNYTQAPDYATLSRVRFYKNENPSALPFDYDNKDETKYIFEIYGKDGTFGGNKSSLSPNEPIYNDTHLILFPGTLPLDESTILDIKFIFNDPVPQTLIHGIYNIRYCEESETFEDGCLYQEPLNTSWLEVAIW